MGLGGYMMWTSVAREIRNLSNLKCLPVESHGNAIRMIDTPVFYNNENFIQPGEKFEYVFPLVLNNPATNYCKKDTHEKAFHKHDRHIIEQICDVYGIQNPDLKCDLFLTDVEELVVEDFLESIASQDSYITIEPHTKDEYTVNKTYPFDKWQYVVDEISKYTKIVQVGQRTERLLTGCIDMTGSTTFREAAGIISKSRLFVGAEGGLMHAANAVDTTSVIVITGFIHPRMTCYPNNTNIWIGKDHGPCGLKIRCSKCEKECFEHDPDEIVESIKRRLEI